jgi:hypothetical protein
MENRIRSIHYENARKDDISNIYRKQTRS